MPITNILSSGYTGMSFNKLQPRKLTQSENDTSEITVPNPQQEVTILTTQRPQDTKVTYQSDQRDLNDLRVIFVDVSPEVLEKIWDSTNRSWDACFDLLRAWQVSHGKVVTISQLEFDLGKYNWPGLTSGVSSIISPMNSLMIVSDEEGLSDGWSLCDTHSDIDENWIDMGTQEGTDLHGTTEKRMSFKDALLKPSSEDNKKKRGRNDDHVNEPNQKIKKPWRPHIVVISVPNKKHGVVYMDSDVMKDALPWDYINEDEELMTAGYGCREPVPTKLFATTALTNSRRVRKAVMQGNNQHVKVLRCKF